MQALEIGKSRAIRAGQKIAILNFGVLLPYAEKAAEMLNATVIDMRFVKPLDIEAVNQVASEHELLITLEDGAIAGGAGGAVAEYILSTTHTSRLLQIGLPDAFIMQGTQTEMYAELGMDDVGIIAKAQAFFK